jgi:2-iminobutanoate/2-iminopropanoate deaminase
MAGAVGRVGIGLLFVGSALAGCGDDDETTSSDTDAPAAVSEVFNQDDGRGYSMASTYGGLVWTAGHLPETSSEHGDIRTQTEEVMDALQSTLEEAGAGFDTVVMTNVYLADFDDWPAFNDAYTTYFGGRLPPRVTVEVASLAFGRIEISMVAHVRDE